MEVNVIKILTLDIETAPNVAHVWQCYKTNVGKDQLLQSHDIMCCAAKWYDIPHIQSVSSYHDGYDYMLHAIHDLLDEADVVVHYNGKAFDIPHLNRAFLAADMGPPSAYKQIDLYHVVKSTFRFPMNGLDFVCDQLGIGKKMRHIGHELWVKCLANDKESWDTMREYNKQDVFITEKLYDRLRPWIRSHPNHNLYVDSDKPVCPKCGSNLLTKQGYAYTNVSRFQQYKCKSCGGWSRGRINTKDRKHTVINIAS